MEFDFNQFAENVIWFVILYATKIIHIKKLGHTEASTTSAMAVIFKMDKKRQKLNGEEYSAFQLIRNNYNWYEIIQTDLD